MSRDVCWHLLLSPQTFSQVAGMYGQIEDDFYFEMHDHLSASHCCALMCYLILVGMFQCSDKLAHALPLPPMKHLAAAVQSNHYLLCYEGSDNKTKRGGSVTKCF